MLISIIYVIAPLPLATSCIWPTTDVLFIIDGTLNLNVYEQLNELEFIRKIFRSMSISSSKVHVAVAQYTPKGKVEFNLDSSQSNSEAESRLQSVSYTPCDPFSKTIPCTPFATLNSLAKQALLPGNRKAVPDVLVLLGSSKYSLPHVGSTEVLFSPVSPIHTYQISVGGPAPSSETFEAAATTLRMHAVDFNSLANLADPLCESVTSFIGDVNTSGFGSICWLIMGLLLLFFVISICIAVYAIYAYRNQALEYQKRVAEAERALRRQNEFFTAKIHEQMEEHIATNKKHAEDIRKQQETLQVQHLELQKQLNSSPVPVISGNHGGQQPIFVPVYGTDRGEEKKHVHDGLTNLPKAGGDNNNTIHLTIDGKEIEVSSGRISTRFLGNDDGKQTVQFRNNGGISKRNDYHRRDGSPYDGRDETGDRRDTNNAVHHSDRRNQGRRDRETSEELNKEGIHVNESESEHDERDGRHGTQPTTSRRPKHVLSRLDLKQSQGGTARHPNFNSADSSEYTETTDESADLSPPPVVGTLPPNHPARALPAVDILFLVDSSSSIGITNFDAMKENICKLLEDIDVAPGRSRVALIQYAQEPSVVFGFDKYYSINSVKKGVQRMSYTGGATMLAKALSFAAGVLYNEQNMKEAKKKHKLMPTPRHDRLQILCVASDGGSDDSIEKAANYLHEKLQVKVLGMVSKSFNKEKLLPVTRFDGSVFVMTQTESMSIWIWRQQKLWTENYSGFLERSRTKAK